MARQSGMITLRAEGKKSRKEKDERKQRKMFCVSCIFVSTAAADQIEQFLEELYAPLAIISVTGPCRHWFLGVFV